MLKDSQELTKTKGTIWKPLIAVSLLSVFSFTAGQYLPYVIIAVSGSGPIAAVPLAIFAVSTVVALISVTYLVKLAISRDDNKKEVGLNGQKFGHTPSQEPQKFVCKNCTNLENKSNVPTPQSPPVTFGTQPNPSANMLQPPPPPLSSCASPPPPPMPTPEQLNQTSGAVPPPPPPQNSSTQQGSNDLLNSIKKAGGKAGMSKEQKKARDEKLKQNREKREKNSEDEQTDSKNALLAEIRGGFKLKSVNKNQQSPEKSTPKTECDIAVILARRVAVECSDSESESSSRESGWSDEGEQEEVGPKQKMPTKHRKKSMPSNPQSFHKERSKSPDSGHVSGDDAKPEPTSPSHPAPEAGKPPIPPKPAGLQTKPEAPPVKEESPVSSEMKDPSTLSVEDRIAQFGGKALRCQKENVVQGL
ncbi:WH2 domain-containing protein [Wolbachia endosymbiont (group A) of Lasioglossum morio]|uniref:WH2 domain-containing protein n=1 Tax=Wolbachia endosymbiont (group A) of Lasioglossum morio TaxID=2954025 RepID=UPI0022263A43|nr:WH2 domain-containing protein [Wolbachia endosymbiont (group A) of Lasioglossum morio]